MYEAGMLKRWRFRKTDHETNFKGLGFSSLLSCMLANREVFDVDAAGAFLEPKMTQLHDPQLLPNISKAASRMSQAVRDGQPIVIYGDYDVDAQDLNLFGDVYCLADFAKPEGQLNFFDVSAFLNLFSAGDPLADLAEPIGEFNFFDVSAFLNSYGSGCP